MPSDPPRGPKTSLEDFARARDSGRVVELIDGALIEKAAPTAEHGLVETKLGESLGPYNRRPGGPRGPGGWWILTEIEILYAQTQEVFRHDLCGYRREQHPERPTGMPQQARPDWVCEVLSPSTARFDIVKKQRTLHRHGVPYYWLVDPASETLSVYRHEAGGYLILLTAATGESVRAEPFEGVELAVGELFGRE